MYRIFCLSGTKLSDIDLHGVKLSNIGLHGVKRSNIDLHGIKRRQFFTGKKGENEGKDCGRLAGYMTLEASFLVTWVIFLMVFLIYLSFYLYDRCVLFQDAYAVCFRGSIQKEEEPLHYINAHMDEQFGKKYFGVGKVDMSAEQSGGEVSVSAACKVKIPFRHFVTLAERSEWQMQTEAKAQILNPTKIIRKCRMAGNVLERLQE